MREHEKCKAAMLYICANVPPDKSGRVKLNKILWFCETETMYQLGHPLTGMPFIRLARGPAPFDVSELRDELIEEGKLREVPPQDNDRLYRYKTLHPIHLDEYFSPREIDIIKEQTSKYRLSEPRDISELSHDSIWCSLEDGDVMPLEAYRFAPRYSHEQKISVKEYARKKWEEDYCDAFAD